MVKSFPVRTAFHNGSWKSKKKVGEGMGSSKKRDSKILGVLGTQQAEHFLRELANLDLEVTTPLGSPVKYPAMASESVSKRLMKLCPEIAAPFQGNFQEWRVVLDWIQVYLRRAWTAADDRSRDWYIYELRRYWRDRLAVIAFAHEQENVNQKLLSAVPGPGIPQEYVDSRLIEPPATSALEAAAFYFQSRIGDRAKHCGHSDCPAPYFIAKKRWQKFCSEECAGPANRESKRKWWNDKRAKGATR